MLVVFCNTGKERPETLDFVERVSCEWGVPVVWLEYRHNGKPTFAIVDYATASRNGEPLEAAITARRGDSGFLPNPMVRYCTIDTKIKTLIRYLLSLGWSRWSNAIGFRADEPARVAKLRAGANREKREEALLPLAVSGVTRADIRAFWDAQPFKLQLGRDEGNCDLCFLKGASKLQRIMSERPDLADWWIRMERESGQRFRNHGSSYAALLAKSQRQSLPMMGDDEPDEPDELSIACHCTD